MAKTRKAVTMLVTVTVPRGLTAAQARREVRTLINEQCNYLDSVPGTWDEVTVKVRQIKAVKS
jgi:hypothetical protein